MKRLEGKREAGYLHEAQLATQRAEVSKIRDNLSPFQTLVIADFAGHYSSNNDKMYQLIFVLYFRNDYGIIDWKYFNVWSDKSATWEFVVRAWQMLFTDGVFDDFNEIFLARDNGGHFRNYNIVKYESEIGALWEKTFRVRSYAPCHGYSHADRHASQVKGAVRRDSVKGRRFEIPDDYVAFLNVNKKSQKSYTLDGHTPLPRDYNAIAKKGHWVGLRRITHIDYGYIDQETGVEFPRARWCARVKVNSNPSFGVVFFGTYPQVDYRFVRHAPPSKNVQ